MSALCGVPDCHIELTHVHRTGGTTYIPNMIGSWVREATSGGGAVTHERKLYVYPRGPGDAPGNQGICSCGQMWPCWRAQAMDSIAAAKAHPAAHADAKWRTIAEPTQEQKGLSNLADLTLDLTTENASLRAEVERLTTHADTMAIAAEAAESAVYRERAARLEETHDFANVLNLMGGRLILAEEWDHACRPMWPPHGFVDSAPCADCGRRIDLRVCLDEIALLSQALSYERDEYAQYREAMERGKL